MESPFIKMLERRRLLRSAGLSAAVAAAFTMKVTGAKAAPAGDIDADILNFALNLEYLEGEFYTRAVFGYGLAQAGVGVSGSGAGSGTQGTVTGGSKVPFMSRTTYNFALEIAQDEMAHVTLLRNALMAAGVYVAAEPNIDLVNSFNTLAQAAGLGQTFNPFDNENDFLLGAFIFEDVGVTAYAGAAPSITSPTYLSTAARILAVEAYHAGEIRTRLLLGGYAATTSKIAALRASLSGSGPGTSFGPDDFGVMGKSGTAKVVDADQHALVFTRTPQQVLSVVYGAAGASSGLFFPSGVNGKINSAS